MKPFQNTAATLSLLFVFFGLETVQAATIDWQVQQSFRYLRYASDHRIHEWALDELRGENETAWRNAPVSHVERKLNNPEWWKRTPAGSSETYLDRLAAIRKEEGRAPDKHDPRLGWGSLLRSSPAGGITGTCWSAGTQSYQSCLSEPGQMTARFDYLSPRHHIVRARARTDAGATPEGTCTFRASGYALFAGADTDARTGRMFRSAEKRDLSLPCAEPVYVRVPHPDGIELTLEITDADGQQQDPVTQKIEVVDFLILGLGDSFASGEGNPEVPAELHTRNTITPYTKDDGDGTQLATHGIARRRTPGTPAYWTDRRCHRSIYSNQARAALHLALHGDRHHAVTFVSFACSGAEVTDGMLWPQDGRECVTGGARLRDPQISAAVDALSLQRNPPAQRFWKTLDRDYWLQVNDPYVVEFQNKYDDLVQFKRRRGLCYGWRPRSARKYPYLRYATVKRPVDLLFFSMGGNDMGFSPLIADRVLRDSVGEGALLRLFGGALTPDKARKRLDFIPRRFKMINAAFDEKLEMNLDESSVVSRLDSRTIRNSRRIVYMTYPSPAHDENGALCGTGRTSMNVSKVFRIKPEAPIGEAQAVFEKLEETIASEAREHDWTLVQGHKADMKTHGFCARNAVSAGESGTGTADILDIPARSGTLDWHAVSEPGSNGDIRPFDPAVNFHPYESRRRWFRTFNDDFLLMQYAKERYVDPPLDEAKLGDLDLATRAIGGPIHPTAQGQARMADHLYCAAAKLLFEADCDPSQAAAPD